MRMTFRSVTWRASDQLLFESLQNLRMIRQLGLDHFDRDLTLQLQVAGLVNGAHAAFTKQGEQLIPPAEQSANLQVGAARVRIETRALRRRRSLRRGAPRPGLWSILGVGIENNRLGVKDGGVGVVRF